MISNNIFIFKECEFSIYTFEAVCNSYKSCEYVLKLLRLFKKKIRNSFFKFTKLKNYNNIFLLKNYTKSTTFLLKHSVYNCDIYTYI